MTRKKLDDRRYEVITQEDDNGDLILPIPPHLLEQLEWQEGDEIEFAANKTGGFVLRKVPKNG